MEEMELMCMQLITAAGGAKSNYIGAIQEAKNGDFDKAAQMIAEGDEMFKQGHSSHSTLIQKEAAGDDFRMGLILTHAEDQMASAETFRVMAEEMIELYKVVSELKK